MTRPAKILAFLIALVVLGGCGALLVFVGAEYLRSHGPSRSLYPVRGIDVSHHQAAIEWPSLAAVNPEVSFAYIKASEGEDHLDTRFQENWAGAVEAGIARGAYHFFTFCTPGDRQAAHFLAVLPPDPDGRTLPPAVDVEFDGNCKSWTSLAEIRGELDVFLRTLEAATPEGPRPVLYVTPRSYRKLVAGHFPDHDLWVRGIYGKPRLTQDRTWLVWQFADRGRLPGIEGDVDLNAFNGDRKDFAAWLRRDVN